MLLTPGESMKVVFSTNRFEVYGITDNTKYKITNEDPKIPITSLQEWQIYALRKNKTKGNKKKIIFIKISHLPSIKYLRDVEELILACYKQKITVIIESTWEAAECIPNSNPDIKSLNDSLNSIKDLIDPEYFRILVSTDLNYIYVNEEYKKLFVYVNMFAILMCLYKKTNKLIPLKLRDKKYNFSCLGGRVIRDHRMFFLSEIFYRNMKNDKFLITAIPPLQHWERKKEASKICPELKLKNLQISQDPEQLNKSFKENALDILPSLSQPEWQKMKNYFIENFNKIVLDHDFIDENTQKTTVDNLKTSLDLPFDKIIPTGLLESYINIPLETYPADCFYTEKTFKPILAGIPFISMCIPNFTESFTNMGFEPYYNIFDYSYENEPNIYKRISLIVDQLQLLHVEDNLKKLVSDNIETIKHNQNQIEKISNDVSFLERI